MLHGDVPEEHKKLATELQRQEIDMEQHITLSPPYVAQAYVCLAHDWYDIEEQEEGHRLLEKAELVCPEYFRKHMQAHCLENPTFMKLVSQLFTMLAWTLIDNLKERK